MGKLWEPGEKYYPARTSGRRKYPPEKNIPQRLARKIFWQAVASILIFIFIWGVFKFDSPLVQPVQGKIRSWFSEDYSVEPVIKFFSDVGLWGDTFDRAAFEAMQYQQDLQRTSLTVPVSGQIARPVEKKDGILIAAAEGSPVKAAMAGVVTRIANEEELGRIVEISDKEGIAATYGHCSEILVNLNDKVLRGQVIAKVGKSGKTLYPQLYFKIIRKGKALDPVELFLPADVRT